MCGGFIGDILSPKVPKLPTAAPGVTPAAGEARGGLRGLIEEGERRRRVQKGGRPSTLLAGQQIAQEQQRKTLLGQ